MSTVTKSKLNAVSSGGAAAGTMSALDASTAQAHQAASAAAPASDIKFCAIDDPTCEACQ